MKQIIKLTENTLRNIIKEAITEIVSEYSESELNRLSPWECAMKWAEAVGSGINPKDNRIYGYIFKAITSNKMIMERIKSGFAKENADISNKIDNSIKSEKIKLNVDKLYYNLKDDVVLEFLNGDNYNAKEESQQDAFVGENINLCVNAIRNGEKEFNAYMGWLLERYGKDYLRVHYDELAMNYAMNSEDIATYKGDIADEKQVDVVGEVVEYRDLMVKGYLRNEYVQFLMNNGKTEKFAGYMSRLSKSDLGALNVVVNLANTNIEKENPELFNGLLSNSPMSQASTNLIYDEIVKQIRARDRNAAGNFFKNAMDKLKKYREFVIAYNEQQEDDRINSMVNEAVRKVLKKLLK